VPRIREVRKRDNRVVPFDQSKITEAIWRALRAAGRGDRSLAEDLASCVTLFLEKRFGDTIPGIEDIQDMIETVLQETGHADICSLYHEYRVKRAKIREILQVHKDTSGGPAVEGTSRTVVFPWQKARIVAALVKEADLELHVAEEVASAVEEKVLRSGLRRISTSLIRELVDNELFERGYSTKLKRQAPIGLPKYNLEQVLFGSDRKEPLSPARDPQEAATAVAQQIFRRYSLEEICSSEVADAVRDGLIVLHGLEEPLRVLRAHLRAEKTYRGKDRLELSAAKALRAVSSELSVDQPPSPRLFSQLGLLAYRSKPLAVIAETLPPVPEANDPATLLSYRVRLHPEQKPAPEILAAAASYYAAGLRVEFVPEARPAPPLVPGKVSLNLPQLAIRSGRTGIGDFLGDLNRVVSLAVKALLERRSFLVRASRAPDMPLWDYLAGPDPVLAFSSGVYAVGIFGLCDAVKFCTGREVFQAEESLDFALQVLRRLVEKVVKESRGLGIPLFVEETTEERILKEAARNDAQRFVEVAEIFRGRREGASYSPGVRPPTEAPLDPLTRNEYLAEMFPLVSLCGIVEESAELRAAGQQVVESLVLESWAFFAEKWRAAGTEAAGVLPGSAAPAV